MIKKIFTLAIAAAITGSAAANYTGKVFDDRNSNGVFDSGDRPLKGVAVSDGLNVTTTDKNGSFTLPGFPRERFIFITTPSGYFTNNAHYLPITPERKEYNFALSAYNNGAAKDGSHRFIQITDTEIFNTADQDLWIDDLRQYAKNEKAAFLIHTGDICYEKGLKGHIDLMNTANMGLPVFYILGNHDLVKGKYGEELFESIYGPVYFSFNVEGTHYIVTPMLSGDHAPGFKRDDLVKWLRNDLAATPKGTPVYIFNHNLNSYTDQFSFKGKSDSISLNDYNLKAWIYGHWHINHVRKQGNVLTVCTSTPDKGGIDHSTSSFRVIDVDSKGNPSSNLRYTYIHNHIQIAAPAGNTAADAIAVNAYSSHSPVEAVTVTCTDGSKPVFKNRKLTQRTDWGWSAPLSLPAKYIGKPLTLKATARLRSGKTVSTEQTFTYNPSAPTPRPTANIDNLLGNASHSAAISHAPIDSVPTLAWTTNIGANIYMTSPLIHNGVVLTASVDEDLRGTSAIYALDLNNGALLWKYPTEGSIKNSIAADGNHVFAQDVNGKLYAVRINDGTTAWTAQMPVAGLPAIIEGIATRNGTVYAGTGNALSAFEAATGKLLWQGGGWNQGEGTTTTLSADDSTLISGSQWSALRANDAATGKLLWSLSENGLSDRGASPAIHNGLIYIVSRQNFFIIDARTGRIVARRQMPVKTDATSTPLLTDKSIIFGTSADGLMAIDSQTFDTLWTAKTAPALIYTVPYSDHEPRTIETCPILAGNRIITTASDGNIYAVDPENGAITWTYSTGAPIFSTPAASGNTLVVTDFGGNIYTFTSR